MPTDHKYWYIVFRNAGNKELFGYFTKYYLITTGQLIGTTVMHFKLKELPEEVEFNTVYAYEGDYAW